MKTVIPFLLALAIVRAQVGFPVSTCPSGGLADKYTQVCCPASCKVCDGSACKTAPGGPDMCCTQNILKSKTAKACTEKGPLPCKGSLIASRCPAGTIPNANKTVCCDAKCKQCGGPGCTEGCCAGNVTKPCFTGARPCVVAVKEPKTCAAGLVADPAKKRCCLASCKTCGGEGCATRKGGSKGCCTGSLFFSCHSRTADAGCIMDTSVCNNSYQDCGYPASKGYQAASTGIATLYEPRDVTTCCNYDTQRCAADPNGTDITTCQKQGPDCGKYGYEGDIAYCGSLATRYGETTHTICCNPAEDYSGVKGETRCVVDPKGGYRTICEKKVPLPCRGSKTLTSCGGIPQRAEDSFCCKAGEKCYINLAFYDNRTSCFTPIKCPPKTVSCGGKMKLYFYDGLYENRSPDTVCCAAGQSCYDQGGGKATVCRTPKTCSTGQTPCGDAYTYNKVASPHTTCCTAAQVCEQSYSGGDGWSQNRTSKCVPKK